MAELHQADAVFQGGGVKGIALVGALLGFAEKGWTDWISVAGTSAGSIIAAYLACGHGPDDLEKLLRETPYEKFQDWGAGGKIIGGGLEPHSPPRSRPRRVLPQVVPRADRGEDLRRREEDRAGRSS